MKKIDKKKKMNKIGRNEIRNLLYYAPPSIIPHLPEPLSCHVLKKFSDMY